MQGLWQWNRNASLWMSQRRCLIPVGRKEVLKTVHKLRKQKNVTVILITHYMEEVVDADKIFVMDHGKVVMEGSPKEIFSK